MDEEKPSEENTESQSNSEDKETINEEKTSVNDKETSEKEEAVSEEKTNEQVSQENELNNPKPQSETNVSEPKANNEELKENIQEETPIEKEPEIKEEFKKKDKPMNKKGKEGSFKPIIFIMVISLIIAFSWDKIPIIKNSVHAVLGPSAGALLTWNLTMGMLIIVLVINLITMLIQKYATDQEALKELKKEQKIIQEEMKKYKDHPQKVAELSKKQFEFIPRTFKLTSRAVMFTGIPFILFFRWFGDVFVAMGDPKFFGVLSWFWFYLIFTMIFSSILRKVFKVV